MARAGLAEAGPLPFLTTKPGVLLFSEKAFLFSSPRDALRLRLLTLLWRAFSLFFSFSPARGRRVSQRFFFFWSGAGNKSTWRDRSTKLRHSSSP